MTEAHVDSIRDFNRFYTRLIGVLDESHLDSPFSLAQVRVLYELAHAPAPPTARMLAEQLGLDPGYLSRTLSALEREKLIVRVRSAVDARQHDLALTSQGRRAFAKLDRKAHDAVAALLAEVPVDRRRRVANAMQQIRDVLEPRAGEPFVLRPHAPGDIGWVVHRHGVLYAQEYGWDERFEALVARIVADFVASFDPARERCWIAERGGEIVGSVFLVAKSRGVAQLRLLYVEPHARGFGIGRRLVAECTRFARIARYRKIVLWTNSVLVSARKLYEAEGYRLVKQEKHREFGVPLVGQFWELDLAVPSPVDDSSSRAR